jgi:hypothetical protein
MSPDRAAAILCERLADRALAQRLFADTDLAGLAPLALYTSGGCRVAAGALADLLALPAVEVLGPDDESLHLAVRTGDGRLIDVEGLTTVAAMRQRWARILEVERREIRVVPCDVATLRARIADDPNGGAARVAVVRDALGAGLPQGVIDALR